ncbi:hypothetical protein ECGD1_018 [Enterobacteria phage ECGD1]|nr:hypothetical protein ECGD1_018 [Enterobacteria phage ECGD1]
MCVPLSSPLLLEFYKAWMEDHSSMHRENVGLCNCLMDYLATTMSKKKTYGRRYRTFQDGS